MEVASLMGAHESAEPRSAVSRVEALLTWLGGGDRRELAERDERSTHAVAGAVVLLGAVLAWLVAILAVSESTRWSMLALVAPALVFGLLVGAIARGIASGPDHGWLGIAGRAAVALAVGVVVGELAALVVFASPIDRRLDEWAMRDADSTPAVAQASAALQQAKDARSGMDNAVERAREQQDRALVIARCEYNPSPGCPQTRITGVPGAGPETRTANQLLADAQHELDNALAARDRQAPELDAAVSRRQQALAEARQGVVADAGRGIGARWVAMNDLTVASTGLLMLRLLTIAFFVLVYLLPLILRLWRGQTTHDRRVTARVERERAELDADTLIAVKRAEVRREAEIMWAEHQLTQARLAIEAQTEIDREQQRRRVLDAVDAPMRASSQRAFEPVQDDIYLPIAAEAEAASRAIAHVPPAGPAAEDDQEKNLPATVEPGGQVEPHHERGTPFIPSFPDATKAAARWIRPLVPPFVARVIDNTTQPLRTARQVFEEVEEITFSLKRTRKVTLDSESSDTGDRSSRPSTTAETPSPTGRIEPPREDRRAYHELGNRHQYPSLGQAAGGLSVEPAERGSRPELTHRDGPRELDAPEGPRQLPPAN